MPVNLFDANFYRAANPDLLGLNDVQALSHFEKYGLDQGLRFSPIVDLNFYRASNSDLTNFSNKQAFEHLEKYGVAEGRKFSPLFDINFYVADNPDLAQVYKGNKEGAFNHFETSGLNEGRKFSLTFDVNYYRSANSDLDTTKLSNKELLDHFALSGSIVGRASSETFNAKFYLSKNPDLAYLSYSQALQHFLTNGLSEGRMKSDYIKSDRAGNTMNDAHKIAVDQEQVTFIDSVGNADPIDFYSFNFASGISNLKILLNGLTANADVELLNSNFEAISRGSNAGKKSELLNVSNLQTGNYYIRVYQGAEGNTNYNLSLSATPAIVSTPVTPTPVTPTITSTSITVESPKEPSSGNYFINRVLELTNAQRLQAGAVPLTLNSKLNNSAQAHSEDMALHDFFDHKGSNFSSMGDRALAAGYNFSQLGENIAAGYATPEDVVQGWMNSPAHRANILNPNYREVGIGYYYLANDTGKINENFYWTQDFGVIYT